MVRRHLAAIHRAQSRACSSSPCGPLPVVDTINAYRYFFPQSGPYPWAIISDPLRAFLFVLVRDPEDFDGSKAEQKVLNKCKKLGFTAAWNSPRKTVQEGCSYTTDPAEAEAEAGAESDAAGVEVQGGGALSSVLELRGGAMGLGAPLHASCKASVGGVHESGGTEERMGVNFLLIIAYKWSPRLLLLPIFCNALSPRLGFRCAQMTMVFPKSFCEEVSGALVTAAEGMTGFDNCNGGNK